MSIYKRGDKVTDRFNGEHFTVIKVRRRDGAIFVKAERDGVEGTIAEGSLCIGWRGKVTPN